jgi:hypothetical protein
VSKAAQRDGGSPSPVVFRDIAAPLFHFRQCATEYRSTLPYVNGRLRLALVRALVVDGSAFPVQISVRCLLDVASGGFAFARRRAIETPMNEAGAYQRRLCIPRSWKHKLNLEDFESGRQNAKVSDVSFVQGERREPSPACRAKLERSKPRAAARSFYGASEIGAAAWPPH